MVDIGVFFLRLENSKKTYTNIILFKTYVSNKLNIFVKINKNVTRKTHR